MVERPLSMREVRGSMPRFSKFLEKKGKKESSTYFSLFFLLSFFGQCVAAQVVLLNGVCFFLVHLTIFG